MSIFLHRVGLLKPVGAAAVLTGAYVESGGNNTTRSFGAAPGAGERRFIVVGCTNHQNGTLSSVSIGGTNGTIVESLTGAALNSCAIGYREVATGTSGNVNATWTGGVGQLRLHIYRLIVTNSGSISVTDSAQDVSPGLAVVALNIAAGGFAVGISQTNSANGPYTWTGLDTTPDDSTDVDSADFSVAGSASFESEQTGLTIRANTADVDNHGLVAASFEPA